MIITVTGNLATEPETKRVGPHNEYQRTELIVLENTGRMTKDGWLEDDEPTRHVVYAWRQLGERAAKLRQGDGVIVVGREYTSGWHDATGAKRRRRVIDAQDIGPSLRSMQVQARRPRKAGLDQEAQSAWNELTTTEPSVRADLLPQDIIHVLTAIDSAVEAAEDRARKHREQFQQQRDSHDLPAAAVHEQDAAELRALRSRLYSAHRVTLEERQPKDNT